MKTLLLVLLVLGAVVGVPLLIAVGVIVWKIAGPILLILAMFAVPFLLIGIAIGKHDGGGS